MPKPSRVCATCGSGYEPDTLFCPKDGTPLGNSRTVPGEDPYLGLVIGDQIELRQLIGIGSMGRVYRAFQRGVERDVAVKMLHREMSANPLLITRFLREARISSRLTHPNVVQVVMAGQLPAQAGDALMGGELYIVMEYLDGISLMSALAATGGAMALPRALHVTLQICDAVGEAHAQGIVHRDLKPENVMMVRRGDDSDFAKVLDFGIARLDWGDESLATQAGLIFGTAKYISPEGSQGQVVSAPADVYAIATILYQCLSGRTPFEADSSVALLMQHAYEAPQPLLSIPRASYVPPPLAAVIMRNLAKSPNDRSPDARSFGRDLVEAARASGLSPDDLVPRSTLLGQRGSHAAFASIQPTNKHHLSPTVAAIIGARGAPSSTNAPPSNADRPSESPVQHEIVTHEHPAHDVASVPTSSPASDVQSGGVRSSSSRAGAFDPSVDLSSEDEQPSAVEHGHGAHRARRIVWIAICAALAVLASAVLFSIVFPVVSTSGATSTHAERANRALAEKRWDSPPGDNVKDITQEGLARNPSDTELLEVRRRAADELIRAALGSKYAGDVPNALLHAKLARDLVPDSTTAQHLVRELEAIVESTGLVRGEVPLGDGAAKERGVAPRAPATRKSAAGPSPKEPVTAQPSSPIPTAHPPVEEHPVEGAAGSTAAPTPTSGGRWL